MKAVGTNSELMRLLCSAAGTGAYGSGEISLSPKGGGDFQKLYEGGIVRLKAVISASGFGGREKLIGLADNAARKLEAFSGEGIICITAPYPAVLVRAEENGFIRIERDIEIIYRG